MVRANTEDDFWSRVDRSGEGCWLWTAGSRDGRYGGFKMDGRTERAHRWAWELTYGPIPVGLHVLHNCDVTMCCRPDHLHLGTHADNMREREERGRNKPRTRASGTHKLTVAQAAEIGRRWEGGRSTAALAEEFGVSPQMVWRIGTGRG